MTREELAARLRIPVEQVTDRGLYEHEFPGVIGCVPENLRSFVIERIGGELLRAGLEDSPGERWRYDAALQNARSMASGEEMQGATRNCHAGGGARPQSGRGALLLGGVATATVAAALALRTEAGSAALASVRRFLQGR